MKESHHSIVAVHQVVTLVAQVQFLVMAHFWFFRIQFRKTKAKGNTKNENEFKPVKTLFLDWSQL